MPPLTAKVIYEQPEIEYVAGLPPLTAKVLRLEDDPEIPVARLGAMVPTDRGGNPKKLFPNPRHVKEEEKMGNLIWIAGAAVLAGLILSR